MVPAMGCLTQRKLFLFGLFAGQVLACVLFLTMNSEETRNVAISETKSPSSQTPGTLCFFFTGRLGNNLFQYAALIGIARQKNMTPVIKHNLGFDQFFHFQAPYDKKGKCSFPRQHWCKRPCAYDFESLDFDSNQDTRLIGSFQSWKYFIAIEQELHEHFKFQQPVLDTAERVLLSEVAIQTQIVYSERILVGIHVRRGDMTSDKQVKGGYLVAPKEYFLNSMAWYRGKFDKILFVVCTVDSEWSKQAIPHEDVVFIPPQQAEVDLAILSLCDHMIMSVGSFGWWAGWLAGGITVYYKHQYREGSELAQHFDMDDYIYPGWIGLE